MKLILARHGNTFDPGDICTYVGCQTDLPLVAKGREQGQRLGHAFAAESIAAIYAGSLIRQQQTAEEIQSVLGYQGPYHPHTSALDEIDYGAWEGKTPEEVSKLWPQEYQAWNELGTWPEGIFGTTRASHQTAIRTWLDDLSSMYSDHDTVLGVSSGGIIRLIGHGLGKVKTGHLCTFTLSNNQLRVESWNHHPGTLTTGAFRCL